MITEAREQEPVGSGYEYGKRYRVHKIYGYKITDAGFVTDLDGRVIGIYNPAYQDGVGLFSVSSAPLYVISSYDGDLLYIGLDMPDMSERFLPFEYVEMQKTGEGTEKFCFGYLQYFTGPYMIPTVYKLTRDWTGTSIAFSFEDPEYSRFSFLKYDKSANGYKLITAGAYGDRFVQNLSGITYRTELNKNAERKKCGDIRIKVIDGYYADTYADGVIK